MAIKDVREYYFTMLAQYLEEKQNLNDFAEALKDGYITEEQLIEAQNIVAGLEENYHRLTYIMYLLEMPNKKEKKARYISQNNILVNEFSSLGADISSVQDENLAALKHFRLKLAELRKNGNA